MRSQQTNAVSAGVGGGRDAAAGPAAEDVGQAANLVDGRLRIAGRDEEVHEDMPTGRNLAQYGCALL
jgi:hypothetical protein